MGVPALPLWSFSTVPGNFPDKALPEQQDSGALLTVSWAAEKTSWPRSEPWVAG